MNFEHIWITSEEHMNAVVEIYKDASWLKRSFGSYDMPDDFPHLKMFWGVFPFSKIPIVFFEHGVLTIDSSLCNFKATKPKFFGAKIVNVPVCLNFELKPEDIKNVSRFHFASPVLKYFDFNFIRCRTHKDLLGGDFLLCAAGLRMGTLRKNTDTLFDELLQLQSAPMAT